MKKLPIARGAVPAPIGVARQPKIPRSTVTPNKPIAPVKAAATIKQWRRRGLGLPKTAIASGFKPVQPPEPSAGIKAFNPVVKVPGIGGKF